MRLQSAIFDMDGTLIDSMSMWRDVSENLLRKKGYDPEPQLYRRLKPLTVDEGSAWLIQEYHLPYTTKELADMVRAEVEDFYCNHAEAKPGVKELLTIFKMEGVWMYVATATDRRLTEAALKHAGIDQYFRGIMTCGEIGHNKNGDPAIYERCMTRLRSNKRDTVVFEDALHAARTAKEAGFRVAGIYDPYAEEDQPELKAICDYYITDFRELFTSDKFDD